MVKLGDLGIAKLVKDTSVSRTYAGTKVYMSPEVHETSYKDDDVGYSFPADIWYTNYIHNTVGLIYFKITLYLYKGRLVV